MIDDAELANVKTAPLIEALIGTEHARVLVLVAGDPCAMSEQAANYSDEQTVASMCHRHHATSHPLAPLTGRELTDLARTTGSDLGAADALDATGGNPALLAAYLGRGTGDPLVPEDASRNRYWAQLARRWPTTGNHPTNRIYAVLVSDPSPAYGLRSAAEAGGAVEAGDVIALLDPGIRSGLVVATRRDCLEWRCPAFARFAARYNRTTTRSMSAISGRDHEPGRISEIVAQTIGFAGLLISGATGYGPLAVRWHAARGLIETASPVRTHESLRLAHGEAILTAYTHPNSTTAKAQALWVTAKAALQLHEWDTAVHLLETALTLYEQSGPPPEWLIEDLGDAAKQGGHYQTAVAAREKLLSRKQSRLGPKHPVTLGVRHDLAAAYRLAGLTSQAINLQRRVLAERVEVLGPKHPDTQNTRNSLAVSYDTAGRTNDAMRLHEQVLAERIEDLGPKHPATLNSRGNLAACYHSAGRYDEAITLEEQVLAERVDVLGSKHPDTLSARNILAVSYASGGRYDEAITLQRRVLAERVEVLGPRHPDTLTSRGNLAVSYHSAGRYDDAIILEEQVLAERVEVLGPKHPATLGTLGNLASNYRLAGRISKAMALEEQVLAERVEVLGSRHPETLSARLNLAVSYHSAGRYDDAIILEEQVVAERVEVLGPKHPDTLTACGNLAVSYHSAGRYDDAIILEEQVLAERIEVLGPKHPDTLTACGNLADSYHSAGRHEDAINLERRVL